MCSSSVGSVATEGRGDGYKQDITWERRSTLITKKPEGGEVNIAQVWCRCLHISLTVVQSLC